ncbi:hypothetical protein AsAng_0039210 [Aureispira anguillae]|uniref:Uncharacterized protein n=1 Tax=Aureispira anguillae TaxID=2864201 RepID=A0A915YHJ4_9BACT|nr:hypothetical protein AsAng_0039210 [Aureispira anguillae]
MSYSNFLEDGFEPPTLMPQAKKERFYSPLHYFYQKATLN